MTFKDHDLTPSAIAPGLRYERMPILDPGGAEKQLFHLATDLSETTDLAAREPARAAALRTELTAWLRSVDAKLPTANPTYDATQPDGRIALRPGSVEAGAQKAKNKK